jgi:peroxiredoxin
VTKSMRWTLPVLGLLAIASVLLVRLNPSEIRYPQIGPVSPKLASVLARLRTRIGSTAPELTFRLIGDDSLHRLSDFRGKVVLLTVWVTGCGPCWAEMPTLNSLQDLHGSDRLAVVTLTSSSPEQVRQFAEKRGVTLPPLSSYSDRLSWVRDSPGPQAKPLTVLIDGWVPNIAWPLTILIDAEGTIREVTFGRRSDEQLQASVRGYV